jgi:hypothetical protein
MGGYEVKFNVYADCQQEADLASTVIKQFISDLALRGIPVTATKIAEAVNKWKGNHFVINYFKNG